jgi:hypothetical protein
MHRRALVLLLPLLAACADRAPTAPLAPARPRFESGSGSDGSGGSGGSGSGGGTTTTGPLRNVFFGQNPLVSGDTTSVLVSYETAPAGGYTIALRSNDPALIVPSTHQAPPGSLALSVPASTTPIANARTISVTVTLAGTSKTASVKLFPRTATLAAPVLFSPGDGAGFDVRRIVDFDWNDQNNAWCYQIQIDDDPGFAGFPAYADVCTPNSFFRQSAFGAAGSTAYWRVRALDASLNPGPWSATRSIRIKS